MESDSDYSMNDSYDEASLDEWESSDDGDSETEENPPPDPDPAPSTSMTNPAG